MFCWMIPSILAWANLRRNTYKDKIDGNRNTFKEKDFKFRWLIPLLCSFSFVHIFDAGRPRLLLYWASLQSVLTPHGKPIHCFFEQNVFLLAALAVWLYGLNCVGPPYVCTSSRKQSSAWHTVP